MKLSEAILLGSVGSEQGYGHTSMFRESKAKCALGAALHAVGQAPSDQEDTWANPETSPYHHVRAVWPFVETRVQHPIRDARYTIMHTIYDLNDMFLWARPQIAQWVATVEPQEVQVLETQHNGGHVAEEVQLR
jgi:hypothetical protein